MILAGATQARDSCLDTARHLLATEAYTVLLIDNPGAPGHHLSKKDSDAWRIWSTKRMATLLLKALHEIEWHVGEPIHVCGFSLGGLIAMQLALLAPRLIASLTLVSVYAHYRQPSRQGLGKKLKSMLTAPLSRAQYAKAELRLLYSDSFLSLPDPTGVFKTCREALAVETLARLKTCRQSLGGFIGQNWACRWHHLSRAQQAQLSSNVPFTLFIVGGKDIIVSPKCSTKLAARSGCALSVLENCGHSPQRQEADVFHELLQAHIDRAASERRVLRFSLSL